MGHAKPVFRRKLSAILFVAALFVGLGAAALDQVQYSVFDRENYLTREQILFIRPGLNVEITDIAVAEDGTVTVTSRYTDDAGRPLDLSGFDTIGPIRAQHVLSCLPPGGGSYIPLNFRTVTSSISGLTGTQPSSETADAGNTVLVEPGVYAFTMATRIPPEIDRDSTCTVGIYADRDLRDTGLGEETGSPGRPVDNEVVNFVPSGGDVVDVRDIVREAACNQCHDPLALHGGFRRETALCILCHTKGMSDPDTGNTIDFRVMVHKIHRGAELPSVRAGTPYQIIGFRNSVNDYSTVEFPPDIRYCDTCHKPGADAAQNQAIDFKAQIVGGTQSQSYLLNPNRAACGACHDDVNFASGVNHPGGPQISDNFCSFCHFPEGELEFDASIRGAHTVPSESRQLEGMNIAITDVQNTNPGDNPTVFFTFTEDDGDVIAPDSVPFFNLNMAGPNTDYTFLAREAAGAGSVPADVVVAGVDGEPQQAAGFMYTFETPLPLDATGSFTVGAESFRMVALNPGTTKEFSHRETAENPVFYFPVTDAEAVPRRTNVIDANCETCHRNLALHGSIRHDPKYCVICHQPLNNDADQRPEAEAPPRTIDFKFLVHRLHTGEELTREFTVFGFGGRPIDFTELRFPGDRRNCAKCHVNDSYRAPSRGVVSTPALREFFSPLPPTTAACLGCHDSITAAAHAALNIAVFGGTTAEACAACHGNGREFSVERAHAR